MRRGVRGPGDRGASALPRSGCRRHAAGSGQTGGISGVGSWLVPLIIDGTIVPGHRRRFGPGQIRRTKVLHLGSGGRALWSVGVQQPSTPIARGKELPRGCARCSAATCAPEYRCCGTTAGSAVSRAPNMISAPRGWPSSKQDASRRCEDDRETVDARTCRACTMVPLCLGWLVAHPYSVSRTRRSRLLPVSVPDRELICHGETTGAVDRGCYHPRRRPPQPSVWAGFLASAPRHEGGLRPLSNTLPGKPGCVMLCDDEPSLVAPDSGCTMFCHEPGLPPADVQGCQLLCGLDNSKEPWQ